jgi:hypothetical protein
MEMRAFLLTLREELTMLKSGLGPNGFSFSEFERIVRARLVYLLTYFVRV